MEFVEGQSLSARLDKQPGGCFEPRQIHPWIEQLADAVDYAHRPPCTIHGSIRPRNLMLTSSGRLQLLEFGVSALISEALSHLSINGRISDAPGSMSPQTASGGVPGHLDDIYAVGATIFELLTGKPPFYEGCRADVLEQVAHVAPPAIQQRREELGIRDRAAIPPAWERAVAACLAKDPAERPQGIHELMHLLKGRTMASISSNIPAASRRSDREDGHPSKPPADDSPLPLAEPAVAAPATTKHTIRRSLLLAGLGATVAAILVFAPEPPPLSRPVAGTPAPTPAFRSTPGIPPDREFLRPEPVRTPGAAATFVNTLGMPFVRVAGTDVLFCQWETRVQDYQQFAEATGRRIDKPTFEQGDDHPVVNISWDDATAFCAWLSTKEGRIYRLPTDHEWSVAAGLDGREEAGKPPASKHTLIRDAWPWGRHWPPPAGAGNYAGEESLFSARIDGYRDGWAFTSPVGHFAANPSGLYDLGGNVWEWCSDWWDGNQTYRVLRGGAFNLDDSTSLLASYRHFVTPDSRFSTHGFRVVVEH
jgi:hypothetical protein